MSDSLHIVYLYIYVESVAGYSPALLSQDILYPTWPQCSLGQARVLWVILSIQSALLHSDISSSSVTLRVYLVEEYLCSSKR